MWKAINNFPNYEINKVGQIRNKTNGMLKKHTLAENGYYIVALYKNNKGKTLHVHRLLAEAFIENPNNLPIVNHKDGIKTNIDLDNLEWATYGDNNQHAYDNGLKRMTTKMMNHAKELHKSSLAKNPHGANRKPIIATRNGIEQEFPSVEAAAIVLEFHRSSIDRVLKGKRKISKGFTFRYLEENQNDE